MVVLDAIGIVVKQVVVGQTKLLSQKPCKHAHVIASLLLIIIFNPFVVIVLLIHAIINNHGVLMILFHTVLQVQTSL